MATDDLVALIERFEGARDELRGVISEAHTAMRDLRDTKRQIDAAMVEVHDAIDTGVDDAIQAAIKGKLEAIQPYLSQKMEDTGDRIERQLDRLVKRLTTARDGVDMRALLEQFAAGEMPTAFVPPPAPRPSRRVTPKGGARGKRRED